MNTAVESDDGNAALRARARRALQSWTDRLAKIVAEGIQRKEIEPAVDAEKLARVVIAALEGALLISRLEKEEAPLREVQGHLDQYLEQNVRAKRQAARHTLNDPTRGRDQARAAIPTEQRVARS